MPSYCMTEVPFGLGFKKFVCFRLMLDGLYRRPVLRDIVQGDECWPRISLCRAVSSFQAALS